MVSGRQVRHYFFYLFTEMLVYGAILRYCIIKRLINKKTGGKVMKKRFLSILLTLCMVLSLVPMTVFAEANDGVKIISEENNGDTPVCTVRQPAQQRA